MEILNKCSEGHLNIQGEKYHGKEETVRDFFGHHAIFGLSLIIKHIEPISIFPLFEVGQKEEELALQGNRLSYQQNDYYLRGIKQSHGKDWEEARGIPKKARRAPLRRRK